MNSLEAVAVAFGVVSVWLSTRQNLASWPTALVNTALYFVVFARAGLYANAGLQVVYFSLSCYGWYAWLYGGEQHKPLVVRRATRRHAMVLAPLAVAVTVIVGFTLSRVQDASLPWLDAGTTAISLVAQWMMTRKLLENWILWNVVNVVYVGMVFSQGLALTAALYAAYIVLAAMGFFSWRASLRAREAAAAA
jgi:nicotinamide mononucleotide transporter